ncbi:MAG: DUF975 family protein [Candidatus Eisenbacteria bacterium]|nr:DUF975 family protein [Candidatus Eisenbacteria bacterium]
MDQQQPGPPPTNIDGSHALPQNQVQPADETILSLALHDGWEALKREPLILIGFHLLKIPLIGMVALMLGGSFALGKAITPHFLHPLQRLILGSIFVLLDGIFSIGILYAALRILRRQPVPFSTFFAPFQRFVPIVIGLVLMQAIVACGIFVLIVPGIVFALALSQWALLVMDRNLDAVEALRVSWRMMRGFKADYFLLWLVLITINLLGAIPLGLGLFVTVPLTFATQAAYYERLSSIRPPLLAQPGA